MSLQSSCTGTRPAAYLAAQNALVAKYTFACLGEDLKRKVDRRILDLLVCSGMPASRAARYKPSLRETQYYGVAALAMALLGIRPALTGILHKERWGHVQDPLVALTGAEAELEKASQEVAQKHRMLVTLSDADRRCLGGERPVPAGTR